MKFDFYEAMQWMEFGETVALKLDEKERRYYMNKNGEIICSPNSEVTYTVKQFYTDAILSKNWYLIS